MSWFKKMVGMELTLDNLEKLLEMQIQDLYSAEDQLIAALPKMAEAASNSELKTAFRSHLAETKQHKVRCERALKELGKKVKGEKCDAMKGLISEGSEVIDAQGDDDVKDAALIAAAQRVEHYEIAGYGCARTFARRLGHDRVAQLMDQTIKEEGAADKKLTQIAEKSVNPHAARTDHRGNGLRRPTRHTTASGRTPNSRRPRAMRTGAR